MRERCAWATDRAAALETRQQFMPLERLLLALNRRPWDLNSDQRLGGWLRRLAMVVPWLASGVCIHDLPTRFAYSRILPGETPQCHIWGVSLLGKDTLDTYLGGRRFQPSLIFSLHNGRLPNLGLAVKSTLLSFASQWSREHDDPRQHSWRILPPPPVLQLSSMQPWGECESLAGPVTQLANR